MRIGLVSDSHGNLGDLERAVSQMGKVEAIFHMGDYVDDALQIKHWTSVPVFAAKGNMDVYSQKGHLFIKTEDVYKRQSLCLIWNTVRTGPLRPIKKALISSHTAALKPVR